MVVAKVLGIKTVFEYISAINTMVWMACILSSSKMF